MTSTIDSVVDWIDNDIFKIDINLPLRNASVSDMTFYEQYMDVGFMNDTGLSILYPKNLDNLITIMERRLTNWDGYYEGYGLQGYVIKRIILYIKAHIRDKRSNRKSNEI